MSIARADIRFLLPAPVHSARVLDGVAGWEAALGSAGIELVAPPRIPDLVVAPARRWREAASSGARGVVLEGGDRRKQLERLGLTPRAHLPVPAPEDPNVLLPLGSPRLTRYALTRMASPRSAWKAGRNRLLARALGLGAPLPGVPLVTVAGTDGPVPHLVKAAARELGLAGVLDWLLVPGRGDVLARGTLQLFPPDALEPGWVLKFSRVRNHGEAFERDERGFAVAADGGATVMRHAPRHVARFAVDGHQASLETAATGPSLTAYLHGHHSRSRKLAVLDAIAAWVVEVGTATAAPSPALEPELDRLAEHVVPRWGPEGAGIDPHGELAGVPATLQHNDLGSWNIVVDGNDFTALDWEDARPRGAPLWDLHYLLMDALAHLDGVPNTLEDRERHFAELFRGELESSAVLFRWLDESVARLGLRREVVPVLTSLCWMHHGLSPETRRADLARHDESAVPPFWLELVERLAHRWLSDPALGSRWPAWAG